ncbi:hypothetical protein [Holophaga foetida]|uniref:hypothetical protein n=1 Tax=Holophaga foetida TaxID=35839 RepID=UPI0002472A5D|nr:hypothetical protein [Holophaga foetida]
MLLAVLPLGAQEISFGLGQLRPLNGVTQTYAWQIQYLQPISAKWGISLTWLNEGHLEDHHRDGLALQFWRFHNMDYHRLRLGLGLGTYRDFDTTGENAASGYRNQHGYKQLISIKSQYPLAGNWDGFIQANRTVGEGDPQTQSILLGFSHRTEAPASVDSSPSPRDESENELTFFVGRTILNSFESQSATAYAIEYRRKLATPLEFTLTYSDEGDTAQLDRDGLALQLWGAADLGQRWGIGFGAGPYFSRVFSRKSGEKTVEFETDLRLTMSLHCQLWEQGVGRLSWNRTLTHYHRDTDVMLAGLGYRW